MPGENNDLPQLTDLLGTPRLGTIPIQTGGTTVVRNPSHLRNTYLRVVGEGRNYPAERAVIDFNENPYEAGSVEFIRYQELTRDSRAEAERRYLTIPEVAIVQLPSKRRLSQPALKLPFDTLHDIKLRLQGGYVFVGANLFYVLDIRDMEGDYLMILKDGNDGKFRCWYKQTPAIDLRTPEPQYISDANLPGFFFRPPMKQQRQAINHDNSFIKRVGHDSFSHCHPLTLVKGLSRESVRWKPMLYDLMTKDRAIQAIRLSKDIAVFRDDTERLVVEYRGRLLGELKEDVILCSETDARRNWIHRDASVIGCALRGVK